MRWRSPSCGATPSSWENAAACSLRSISCTGVSRRLHAAFETLSAVGAPGDIGATARYFSCDITDPPYTAERGMVTLNREGHASGLGCDLNRSALENVLVERLVIA